MKICYFGIYDPEFGRNKVYISGLKQKGIEIIECRDASPGLLKFFRLWRRHRALRKAGGDSPKSCKAYDALVVGYPGHIVVPFAKMLTKKPVVFDALATLYEGEVISRGKYPYNPLMRSWINFIDMAAAKAADVILVETNAQREFFIKRFELEPAKVFRVFTGALPEVLPAAKIKKHDTFTAVFRGKFLPEAGVGYIVEAAKALEEQGVNFLIIGNGHVEKEVACLIQTLQPSNLEWLSEYLPAEELSRKMLECHVSLGQFEKHERLDRTIPHKAFESLFLGLPYITGRAAGISELLTDGKDCLLANCADAEDLAAKILQLKNNPELRETLAKNGRELYESRLTPAALAGDILNAILAQKSRLRI